jgi:hypothetical protein
MSFSLVETRVPGEKPLQAKLRADYFSLPLFLYLQWTKLERLGRDKHASLFGPFVSYEEKKVL